MVPCLHQSNLFIKTKLRLWRVQKCIPLVGAKTTLTCVDLQTTLSHVKLSTAENGNLRKFGSTICHGTVFAPNHCLYKIEGAGMGVQKFILLVGAKTALTCAGLQTTTTHVRRYSCTFHLGTMFVPKQSLYQKEAAGMESPKMYSCSWCKNRTYLCGPSNYPVSCETVYSREQKFAEVQVYL